MKAWALPVKPDELEFLRRVWELEGNLGNSALLLELDGIAGEDLARLWKAAASITHWVRFAQISRRSRWAISCMRMAVSCGSGSAVATRSGTRIAGCRKPTTCGESTRFEMAMAG